MGENVNLQSRTSQIMNLVQEKLLQSYNRMCSITLTEYTKKKKIPNMLGMTQERCKGIMKMMVKEKIT